MASVKDEKKDPAVATSTPADDDEDDFSQFGDLTDDGGVVKEILVKGDGWQRPEFGDDVQMHYKGSLVDGTIFDSSYERDAPFSFKLGDGKVIKGWDIVGKTMAKGEKARVTLKPEYGYGAEGSPPKIPPNSTLIFEMELLSWQSKRDVFGDGTVLKSELETGEGWERPGKLAEVTVDVIASEVSTKDNSKGKVLHTGEFTFPVGVGAVPRVWDKVIQDMKRKARVVITCKPPHVGGPKIDFLPAGLEQVQYDIKLKSWLKVEDIFDDGSLVKKVMSEGDGWERPKEGSVVKVDMEYFLLDGATGKKKAGDPFMTSKGIKFTVGDGDVVDGIDRTVQSMKAKEVAEVKVQAKHAFETATNLLTSEISGKGVKDSDDIHVNVTLLEFEKAKDMWSMGFDEKADAMQTRKLKGNELMKVGRHLLAKNSYERAVAFFDSPTSELEQELRKRVNLLLVQCHLNLAMCNDRLGDLPKVMEHCKKALEISPANGKALYRRGCAFLNMDDFYNAESDFKYALELDRNNTAARRKLYELRKMRAEQDKKDRKLFSNLFTRLDKMESKEKKASKTTDGAEVPKDDMEIAGKTPEKADAMEVDVKEAPKAST